MFTRDILVFDLETTGMDYVKHEIIQIAALLLDKNSLEEKQYFESYIKPERIESADPEALTVHGIEYQSLQDKPSFAEVALKLEENFHPDSVILSAYNTPFDVPFLRLAYSKTGRAMPYDLHSLDIWGLAYKYWSSGGFPVNPKKKVGFGLSDMAKVLGIEAGGFHNASTDVKVSAEVLRRLLAKLEMSK